MRYRFRSWNDGGSRSRTVAVPESGGSLTLNLAPEYRLRASGDAPGQGVIRFSQRPEGGFYSSGALVSVTAAPETGWHFAGWTGDVSSDQRVTTVVMDGPKSLAAAFTQSEPLRLGAAKEITLPALDWPQLHSYGSGHNVFVPADAVELAVEFHSSSTAEVDMYISHGHEVGLHALSVGGTPKIEADFESRSPGASERIVIDRNSTPPLVEGMYFVGLNVQPSRQDVRGTLSASIKRRGIAKVDPRAFTFVSPSGFDPLPQPLRVRHLGNGLSRFRVESDRAWLAADPREWTWVGPGIRDLSITVNNAALLSGTHRGKLRIVIPDSERPAGGMPTGVEIPVTFVNVGPLVTVPEVSAVTIASEPRANGTYNSGAEIEVEIQFTRPVAVDGSPELALAIGNRRRRARWNRNRSARSCGESYATLMFTYMVEGSDTDADGIGVPADGLTLNGGTIRGLAGTDARLDLGRSAVADSADHKVDGSRSVIPELGGLWIVSSPQNGNIYGAGEPIEVALEFDVPVEVTGHPRLALLIGNRRVQAAFTGSNQNWVWFRHVVQAADRDTDGIGVPADGLTLNGGTIRGLAGADVRLPLGVPAIAGDPGHKVDGSRATVPVVRGLWLSGQPRRDGIYGVGEAIEVGLELTLLTEVTGRPQLALLIGNRRVQAAFAGYGDNWIWFRYVVQAGDRDADGISVPANALTLNGGTIRSVAGADATLGLGSHAVDNDSRFKVDGRE